MNGGGCTNAREFCGACEDRADSYFVANQLPCCIENVVQKSIEVNFHDLQLFETYSSIAHKSVYEPIMLTENLYSPYIS